MIHSIAGSHFGGNAAITFRICYIGTNKANGNVLMTVVAVVKFAPTRRYEGSASKTEPRFRVATLRALVAWSLRDSARYRLLIAATRPPPRLCTLNCLVKINIYQRTAR